MKRLFIFLFMIGSIFGQTGDIYVNENHHDKTITNVSHPPVNPHDAATKAYVDSIGGGGAPTTAHYITTQAEAGLSNEFSLGALTSGLLKQTVSSGVSTPAIAAGGTDYEFPLSFTAPLSRSTNTISEHVADATHDGYLSSADWNIFTAGAGGGTVTSFSAGILSPLFTTSVSNPTTTPALSFTLSNAAAHTFFGNNTGSSSAPSFTSFAAGSDYEVPLTFNTSLSRSTNTVTLLNDSSPAAGARYFYGQDVGGIKGWQPFIDVGGGGGGNVTGPASSTDNAVVRWDGTTGQLVQNSSATIDDSGNLTSTNSPNWDTAYTDRLKWDGGATGLTASTGRISLGATTVGSNIFTVPNPSAIRFLKVNADNSVTLEDASTMLGDLGGTGSGIVSDTAFASSWNGVTGTAPSKNAVYDEIHLFDTADDGTIINAGTGFRIAGAATSRKILVGNGTNFVASTETYAVPGTSGNVLTSDGTNWTSAAATGGATGANPTAKVGVTAVNGSASTFMRSDAAPPIDQTIDLAHTAAQSISLDNATTAAVDNMFKYNNTSTGTVAAGFGSGLKFGLESANGTLRDAAQVRVLWVTATDATRASAIDIQGVTAGGSLTLLARFWGSKNLTVGSGSSEPNVVGGGICSADGGFQIAAAAPTNGTFLQSDASKFTTSGYTLPASAGTSRKILVSNGSNIVSSTETWAIPGTSGNILTSNGTNWTSAGPAWGGGTTAHGDSDYTILLTDRVVYTNAAFTTTRIWTLPAASTVTAGTAIQVIDWGNALTSSNNLSVTTNGSDKIQPNTVSSYLLTATGSGVCLVSDGSTKWYVTNYDTGARTANRFIQSSTANSAWVQSAYALPATVGVSGKVLISDGTNYGDSTPTWPTTASTSNKVVQSNGTNFVSQFLLGTITNDNAPSGGVGEEVESLIASGSATSLTTATAKNITSISLTAGDWDVSGNVNFSETTSTVTARSAGVTSTSATVPTDGSEAYCGVQSTVTSETNSITLPRKRFSLSGTTTVYLVGSATFSAGTCSGFGAITARRVR